MVSFLLPPKNGSASARKGSISFLMAAIHSSPFCCFSSSLWARKMENMKEPTLVSHVSTNQFTRARASAANEELLDTGRRWEGKRSARNCATTADSVMISSLSSPSLYLIEGTRPRYRNVNSQSLNVFVMRLWTWGRWGPPYWVHFQIPWVAGPGEINNGLFKRQAKLLERDVSPVRIWAAMVGVKMDLWLGHCRVGVGWSSLPQESFLLRNISDDVVSKLSQSRPISHYLYLNIHVYQATIYPLTHRGSHPPR